jgi:endonuclease/exonuclease/phosphatase (EEP) superfamily protein YafD
LVNGFGFDVQLLQRVDLRTEPQRFHFDEVDRKRRSGVEPVLLAGDVDALVWRADERP